MQPANTRVPRWSRAAYSEWPTVHGEAGNYVARASIECWKGTPEELGQVISTLAASFTNGSIEILIVLANGDMVTVSSPDAMIAELAKFSGEDVFMVRAIANSSDTQSSATIVARRKIPGIEVRVTSPDRALTLGVAELTYRDMMAGYVDRISSSRALAWFALALSPLLLVIFLLNAAVNESSVRIGLVFLAGIAAVSILLTSYRLLLIRTPFTLIRKLPKPQNLSWRSRLTTIYRHRWTKPTIGAIVAVILGIVGTSYQN